MFLFFCSTSDRVETKSHKALHSSVISVTVNLNNTAVQDVTVKKTTETMRATKTFLLWMITSLSCAHWSDRNCSCCSLLWKVVVPLCTRIWRIFMTTGCAVWYFCVSDITVVDWHGVRFVVTLVVAVLVCTSWHDLADMTGHIFCCRCAKIWLWEDSMWRTTNFCPSVSALTMMMDGQAVLHDLSNDSKSHLKLQLVTGYFFFSQRNITTLDLRVLRGT